jgi:hypothetical protein
MPQNPEEENGNRAKKEKRENTHPRTQKRLQIKKDVTFIVFEVLHFVFDPYASC